jgi:Domain of unknown function (DUF4331)
LARLFSPEADKTMSDHFSGPRALADPAADICDVYAFPSPERAGCVVLVMDLFPYASSSALFSDAVICRFRVRPVTAAATGPAAAFAVGEQEFTFDCTFGVPAKREGDEALVQMATCTGPNGESGSFLVNDEKGGGADGLRFYSGVRSDPFILDGSAIENTFVTGRLAFRETGLNNLLGANVLSVVVEVDRDKLPAGGPLFAVVGETLTSGKDHRRLERVGRPEMKNITLGWSAFDKINPNLEIREVFNDDDAFDLLKTHLDTYRARFNANLAFFDGLDGKTDWPLDERGNHPLTELLLHDFLVVDVSKPFAEDSYFEIEQAMLHGRPHATCGGRWLNEDMMDKYYTLLINAGHGPRIRDGVDEPTVLASSVFPYLAPAHVPGQPLPTKKTGD